MGDWGAEVAAGAFWAGAAAFSVSFGAWACTGAAAGTGVSCFVSCLAWAGLEGAAAAADASSSYWIKSAPTSSCSCSPANNFLITPAPSDLISTYLIIFNINYKYLHWLCQFRLRQ